MQQQTMDWRVALQFASVGIVIVLVLWLAGIINNLWMGFGILAIGHAFVVVSYLPAWRKTATVLMIAWTVGTMGWLIVWNKFSPQVQDAISSRKLEEETRISETIRGHGAEGMQILAMHCSQTETMYVNEIIEIQKQLSLLTLNDSNRHNKEALLKNKVAKLLEWRKKCTQEIQYTSEESHKFFEILGGYVPKERAQLIYWFIGSCFLFGLALYGATGKSRWYNYVGGFAVLLAVLLFGDTVLFRAKVLDKITEELELEPEKKGAGEVKKLTPACVIDVNIKDPTHWYNVSQAVGKDPMYSGCNNIVFLLRKGGGSLRFNGDPCAGRGNGSKGVASYGGGGYVEYVGGGEIKSFAGKKPETEWNMPFQLTGTADWAGKVTVTCQ